MKTILKVTVMVALMFTAVVGMANEPKLNLIANAGAKSLVFKLDAPSDQTRIRIMDTDNNVIYSENLKKDGAYNKKFDLRNLDAGLYFLRMENPLKVIEYTIDVKDTYLEIIDRKENAKPVFRTKGDIVFLNLLNLEQESVAIKVYDSSYRLVYSETLTDKLLVEKVFNFESAQKDKYTVVVKDNTSTYYQDIVVD